jgi:hypothetical protein
VFGLSRNPYQQFPNKERTCLFHWVQSLELHTNRLIQGLHLWAKHMELCKNYKKSKTLAKANAKFEVIRSWWHSFCESLSIDLEELNHWLSFWHFQVE